MQLNLFDATAPRKPANLSINSDLLQQAKELHINLSQALEQRLTEILLEEKRKSWRTDNQGAVDEYNNRIEARGVFSDGLRQF